MGQGKHERRRRWGFAGVAILLAAALPLVVVAANLARPTAAKAAGGKTVVTTINVPAMVVDNLCNLDTVNLHGDMTIRTTTTPTRNGGYTVQTSLNARGLQGSRITPPPAIGYHGDDRENTYSYYAPPPYPSTHRVAHWTKLVPEVNAPTMYLVIILKETILADGTVVPVLDRMYLVCQQPSCWSKRS